MNVNTVIGFVVTTILLMIIGILSLLKADLVGVEFYWQRHNWFYIPKYRKSTNTYYHNQIRVLGIGFIVSSLVMLILTVFYVVNPDILLLLKYNK